MGSRREVERNFFARAAGEPVLSLLRLFDHLSDVYVFVKDRKGRFVHGNRALALLHGRGREIDVRGRTDFDFSPVHLAEKYARDDARVLSTGEPLVDLVEPVRNQDGSIDWYNTTKLPVRSRRGDVIGVAGLTRDLKKSASTGARFMEMAPVVEAILSGYAAPLSVPDLARRAGLTLRVFERQFRRAFRTTPRKYIIDVRMNAACQLLADTDLPVAAIAERTGFYDASHFTHQFARHRGTNPLDYRRRQRAGER